MGQWTGTNEQHVAGTAGERFEFGRAERSWADTAVARPASSPLLMLGFWGFCFYAFAYYSRLLDVGPARYLHLPAVTCGFAIIMAVLSGRIIEVLQDRIAICLMALTFWLAIGVPGSYWRGGSFAVLTKAWIPSMMIFLSGAAVIVTLKQCRRSLYVVGVATATGALLLMLRGRISHERLVLEGTSYGNSNTIAIMLLVGMPMVWLLAASARAGLLRKVLVGGVMILMLVALFRTGSREGVVGLAVLLGTAFVRSSMAGKVKLVIAVAALVAGAVLFLPHSLKSRFATVFQGATVEVEGAQTPEEQRLLMVASRSSSDRWALLRTSLDLTLRHPLLGVGPGQFAPYVAGVAKDKGMLTGWNGTHNTYTQLSSEAGIPALCLYVATMLVSMRGLQRICRRARGVTGGEARDIASMALALHASFIAYCVCALFNHMAYELTMPLMAGITVAIRRLAPDELNRLEDAERRQVGVPLSFLPVSPKRSRSVAGGGRTA